VEIGAPPGGPGVCGPAYVGACTVLGLSAGLDDEQRSHHPKNGLLHNKGLDQCCVSARLPSRGMIKVSRGDIAEIGASVCPRLSVCE